MVSTRRKPRHVFVRFSNEEDFLKALSKESCDVDRIGYRPFQWTTDFNKNSEPTLVRVGITVALKL